MRTSVRLATALAGVLVGAVGCGAPSSAPGPVPHASARPEEQVSAMCGDYAAASVAREQIVTGSGPRVVVIGDSWATGYGLDDPAMSWPRYLSGEIHVAAFNGTGYDERTQRGCGPLSFGDRTPGALKGGADLVVLEGGINDANWPLPEVEAGFRRTLNELKGYHVVVLSAPSVPTRAAKLVGVNQLLKRVSAEYGVTYVDVYDIKLPYQHDHVHPTLAGHREFGRIVAQRIARSGAAVDVGARG
ncbi:MAG: SGNH/GDSL hydrolase family protein [Nocardioides sp.]|nr:SGNH/GDSL hydrolase family protein [Nocardioides sp.]